MKDVPELGALELLVAAVRSGSISAAARESGIAQQSASARLRTLERMLGLELLQRTTRGVEPTAAGETVAAWAEEVVVAAGRFAVGVGMLRGERSRELAVAASQTVAAHLLPAWLVGLRERQLRAGVEPTAVTLIAGNSREVAELVRDGHADLGFIESSALPERLAHAVVGEDPLALVVAPGHPWAAADSISMAEAADAALVTREAGSGTRQTWEDAVRARLSREPGEPLAVLPTSAAVRSAVANGLAPALLSRLVVADDLALGRLVEVPIEGELVSRPITALWRGTARDLGPTSRELLEVAAG